MYITPEVKFRKKIFKFYFLFLNKLIHVTASTYQPTCNLTSIYLTFIFHLVLLPVEMIYIIIFYLYSILSLKTYLK